MATRVRQVLNSPMFKGTQTLQPTGQVEAVRQLDRSGTLATKEFLIEVLLLSLLCHPNLVSFVGYCADGDQRLLVYEYMTSGSLDDYLFSICKIFSFNAKRRRAFDNARPIDDQKQLLGDPKRFPKMADPRLRQEFLVTSLNPAVRVGAMCLQEDPSVRPFIGNVVAPLGFLPIAPPGGTLPKLLSARTPSPSSETSSEHTEDLT